LTLRRRGGYYPKMKVVQILGNLLLTELSPKEWQRSPPATEIATEGMSTRMLYLVLR
jgi:hypothetical protein